MNKDQIKGAVKEVAGKVQRKTGELIDSPGQQAKGAAKEIAGKVQGRTICLAWRKESALAAPLRELARVMAKAASAIPAVH